MAGRNRSLASVAAFTHRARSLMKRNLGLVLVSVALGLASFAIQFQAAHPLVLDETVAEFASRQAEFELLEAPREISASNSHRVAIRLRKVMVGDSRIAVNARGELRGGIEIAELKNGAGYSCRLNFSPSRAAERAGFFARCADAPTQLQAEPTINAAVATVRSSFNFSIAGVTRDSAALVAGLAIGETQKLSSSITQDMKTVSLTHLTAVSGANCAIVIGLFYFLFRYFGLPRWLRTLLGLVALAAYVLLVGAQPSVIRAAVMTGMVMLAIGAGRKTKATHALALAIIVLLISDPWLAADYGFALSVAATLGILILTPPLTEKLEAHLPRYLAIAVAVGLAAQIFCLPILLQLQGGLATYALAANLIAEPLVAPITILGIMACVVAPIAPWLSMPIIYLASLPAWIIELTAKNFASLPHTVIAWPTEAMGVIAGVSVIGASLLWLYAKPTRARNLGVLTLALLSGVTAGALAVQQARLVAWPQSKWQVVACDVGQGDAIVIRDSNQVALIDTGREPKLITRCLSELNIQRIDLLVLTHFDQDHVGGIAGVLGKRSVGAALVSPFTDTRWAASGCDRLLAAASVQPIQAERGMSGTLGNARWQVLSPNRAASGAEDSNSASLVLLFEFQTFNLLAMADAPEQAQMQLALKSNLLALPTLHTVPLVLKVSHHGSADQFPELIEELNPELSIISVGKGNSYGHPTARTLSLLTRTGSTILRTDELGAIAVAGGDSGLTYSSAGRG